MWSYFNVYLVKILLFYLSGPIWQEKTEKDTSKVKMKTLESNFAPQISKST